MLGVDVIFVGKCCEVCFVVVEDGDDSWGGWGLDGGDDGVRDEVGVEDVLVQEWFFFFVCGYIGDV